MLGYIIRFKLKNILKCLVICLGCFIFIQITLNYRSTEVKSYPIILWWTPFMAEDERVINCFDKYKCILVKDRNYSNISAYLFYGSDFNAADLPVPKHKDGVWALFHEESPRNNAIFLFNETQKIFDFRATFSRNSEMPLTLQYLENMNFLTDARYFVEIQEKNKLLSDNIAPIVYIQSDCDTPNNRDDYVKELMKYIDIDSYGSCLKNKDFPKELSEIYNLDLYNELLLKFIAKYKFVIAFENAICDDYITEKLWRPLAVGSIPIYMGSPHVENWLPNKDSAILVKNFADPRQLADFIKTVNENDELYLRFVEHKFGKVGNQLLEAALKKGAYGIDSDQDNPVSAFECFVCRAVYEGFKKINPQTVYNCPEPQNSWSFFWQSGKCESDVLAKYVKHGGSYKDHTCS